MMRLSHFLPVLALSCAALHVLADEVPAKAAAPASAAASAPARVVVAPERVQQLYQQICTQCHGADRLGGIGPALLPENLERLKPAEARKVISDGREATQMIGYKDQITPDEVAAIAEWIYTPVTPAPVWGEAEIRASRTVNPDAAKLPAKPIYKADPENLFVVVESGDSHVSILDGDKLEPIARFASHFALHGGPKFTPDGHYVYFGSRDGWITKYDLWALQVVVEARAGINMRNIAVSGDGKWVMAANYLPHNLVVLDARDLTLKKIIPAVSLRGEKKSSRVSAVYDAAPRKSFIATMKDIPEVWEISYDPHAQPVNDGIVHDFQYQEGDFKPGQFTPRRTYLNDYLDDFFFTQSYDELMGSSRDGAKGQVVNLDARRKIADLDISGMPHLGSGITWEWKDTQGNTRTVMASTNLREGQVTVIDLGNWQKIKDIATPGPGFFIRGHELSPNVWVDSMMSPKNRNTLTIINKNTFAVVGSVKAEPGQTLAHIEFTQDGRYALASLMEDKGAIIVYDARTLREVKRIPMSKPIGKYNVFNKTTRSSGTSH
ncbi:MAG: nitrite reductase [Burkholderiaceae bacterium]|jgi:mono/diheme cytochrome c family protein/DNA-binding beta-propeller fold protein YncE|nr:nitrite reductase [Burkholderiaceae bacterium]